jgi:DNA-binding transcriptional regulator LsrR (DeoR family)
LAEVLGARVRPLPSFAFPGASPDDATGQERLPPWPFAHVALLGCGAVTADESREPGMPLPPALEAMLSQRCVGEVGGICVDADGVEVAAESHQRCGLSLNGLRHSAAAGGSVLVVHGAETDVRSALAALRGGLVSVLVASRETAQRIIALEAEGETS